MDMESYAKRVETMRAKLYRTALCYFGDPSAAQEVLDEAVYRGLCACGRLREPDRFEGWMTRILINECHRELKRRSRFRSLEEVPELTAEMLDALPLREAVQHLPKEWKDVVILRFFSGYSQAETAETLQIPQGTVKTRQRKALQLLRLELEEAAL